MSRRILICGGRHFSDRALVEFAFDNQCIGDTDTIVHGAAPGADSLASLVAEGRYCRIDQFPADWSKGRAAGPIRNKKMLDTNPDFVLAFWDGKSRGTKNCMDQAVSRDIPVVVYYYKAGE